MNTKEPGMTPSKKIDPIMATTACDVLESLRDCVKTLNFSPVLGYIEELQSMFGRMETALEDYAGEYGGLTQVRSDIREFKAKKRKLRVEVEKLKIDRDELQDQIESDQDGLRQIGEEVVKAMSDYLSVSLPVAGACFTKMRKRGIFFGKNSHDRDEEDK